MDVKAQHGYLVLADICGYTAYLAGVELEHAHGILTELLELIVERLKPVLTIAKLEGDAVFAYTSEARMPRGETLLELIEATYAAFKDRVEAIRRQSTCECKACRSAPKLDLKFMLHHGDYIVQSVAGIHELVGTDVNLVHRLLKNRVKEATGWSAYALFTGPGLEHMCVRPEPMHEQTEVYDLGEVQTYSLNLHDRYAELVDTRRVVVTPEEADAVLVLEYNTSPPMVWAWLNSPEKRQVWETTDMRPVALPKGRMSAGARSHCIHGENAVMVETVLDWRPFEYFTVEKQIREGVTMMFTVTTYLEPIPTGTRVRVHTRFSMDVPRAFLRPLCRLFLRMFGIHQNYQRLGRMIAADRLDEQPAALALALK